MMKLTKILKEQRLSKVKLKETIQSLLEEASESRPERLRDLVAEASLEGEAVKALDIELLSSFVLGACTESEKERVISALSSSDSLRIQVAMVAKELIEELEGWNITENQISERSTTKVSSDSKASSTVTIGRTKSATRNVAAFHVHDSD